MSKNSEAFEKALARANAIAAGAAQHPMDGLTEEQKGQLEAEVGGLVGETGEEVEAGPVISRGVMLFETSDGQFGMRPIDGTDTTLADVISLARRAEMDALVNAVTDSVMAALRAATKENSSGKPGLLRMPRIGR